MLEVVFEDLRLFKGFICFQTDFKVLLSCSGMKDKTRPLSLLQSVTVQTFSIQKSRTTLCPLQL